MSADKTETIPKRILLRDVAAAAGVSVATASRVLAGEGASDEAAAAVRAAVERLDYRPNRAARALRSQSSGLIGMIVPSISNPFFAELVEALERALHEDDRELVLADSSGSPEDERRRLRILADRDVDGLLIIPTHHESSAESLRSVQSLPLVQLDRHVDTFAGDYVGVDNATGINMMLEHLRDEGCRRLVFVSEAHGSSTGISRIEAFEFLVRRSAVLEADAPILGTYSLQFGSEAARTIVDRGSLPDAIVCGSDLIALGVIQGLKRLGIAVPRDVRVTGFDGILFSTLSDPPLTTVEQPITAIANEAIRLLRSRIEGSDVPPRKSEVTPILRVRESSRDRQTAV